jgi:hypothetical protein
MIRLFYLSIVIMACHTQLGAQSSINDYKYIVVPKQFDFLQSKDQYQTSSLTKFLFNKYGYTVFFDDDDLPKDLSENRCLGLSAEIKSLKGFLITKLQIDLIDCNDNVVMSSAVGETKVKEYSKSYQLAIRDAFETYQNFDYKYVPKDNGVSSGSQPDDMSGIKVVSDLTSNDLKQKETRKTALLEVNKEDVTVPLDTSKEVVQELNDVKVTQSVSNDILYAQPIKNGFQIVDTEPKKVMILLETGVSNVFMVKGKDAMVYKKDGTWVYGSYSGDDLKFNVINLKF